MNSASLSAVALMALMKLPKVGRRAALRIVNAPSSDIDPISYQLSIVARAEQVKLPSTGLAAAWKQSEEQLEKSVTAGIQAFSVFDEGYPSRLRKIPDHPAVIFVKGSTSGLHGSKVLAIVGTREPTSYGETVARRSGKSAAEAGFVVVSGLAHGCDALGHEGCLERNGFGVAVMAHGLDKVYPAANRELAARLLDNGGCLVSEYPIGVTPIRAAFAERDRIQSGLSDGILVIETDVKGGTMHTVRFSREQNRPIACISHPEKYLSEDKTRGNQKLIADGWAAPISDGSALIEFLHRISNSPVVRDRKDDVHPTEEEPAQRSWAF
jgi:DNA processing protein